MELSGIAQIEFSLIFQLIYATFVREGLFPFHFFVRFNELVTKIDCYFKSFFTNLKDSSFRYNVMSWSYRCSNKCIYNALVFPQSSRGCEGSSCDEGGHGSDRCPRQHKHPQRRVHHDQGGRMVRFDGQRGRSCHASVWQGPLRVTQVTAKPRTTSLTSFGTKSEEYRS